MEDKNNATQQLVFNLLKTRKAMAELRVKLADIEFRYEEEKNDLLNYCDKIEECFLDLDNNAEGAKDPEFFAHNVHLIKAFLSGFTNRLKSVQNETAQRIYNFYFNATGLNN